MEQQFDAAVIGGGIAGYSAALTLKSLRLNALWLGDNAFGGKLARSEYVRNYPAFTGDGAEFAAALSRQAVEEAVPFTAGRADGVYAVEGGYLVTAGERQFFSRTVILCTGVSASGSIAGEAAFLGRGVSYCAVCDGALYRGKKVAAVLSSAEFSREAEYLAGFAAEVNVYCKAALPPFAANNIRVSSDMPRAVEGDLRVRRLTLQSGAAVSADGVFFLRESAPPASLVGGLETDGGHVRVSRDLSTNLPGLFAAGDVTGRPYQFVKAAGEGCVAAYSVLSYLNAQKRGART